jgi:hypothetical protein
MQKILILTSDFLPEPDANGINVNIISQELMSRGHEVTCLSYKNNSLPDYETINGIKIYRITPSFFSQILNYEKSDDVSFFMMVVVKLAKILRKVKLALLLFNFPDYDIIQDYKLYWKVRKMMRNSKYDMILGVYKPFTNISALLKIKRNTPEIMCGAYYLDLVNSMQKPSIMPRKVYQWLCKKADYKVFNKLDFALVAKAGKTLYTDQIFNSIVSKINYVDFPTFQMNNDIDMKSNYVKKNKDTIDLIYAGTLDRNYRNPEYLLSLLKKLTRFGIKINFNVYGRGNCDEILCSYNDKDELRVYNHGLVDLSIIREEMLNADFVVNISNEIDSAVPSKIFELFSTGKPIINVAANKNDISNSYFEKYPSFFSIYNKESVEYQINDLYKFIISERGKIYSVDEIAKNYKENTPSYTVDIIEEKLNKQSN